MKYILYVVFYLINISSYCQINSEFEIRGFIEGKNYNDQYAYLSIADYQTGNDLNYLDSKVYTD